MLPSPGDSRAPAMSTPHGSGATNRLGFRTVTLAHYTPEPGALFTEMLAALSG